MKNFKIIIIITFISLFFLPCKISALENSSDYYSINSNNINYSVENINYNLTYSKNYARTSGETYGWISGSINNTSSEDINIHEELYLYDSNKNEIGKAKNNSYYKANSMNTFNIDFYETDIYSNYTISDIAYFKLYIKSVDNSEEITPTNNEKVNTIGNGEYALTKYNINIKVNENNTFNIIENITANFNVKKHGIYRKIPLKNKIVRLDGTKSFNIANISNISVNEQYSLSNEIGYYIIKVGNPNNTFTGEKNYVIRYLYNLGKDKSKAYDELYFNIIGDEWDTTISRITFKIDMPKDFDQTKIGFSSGTKGSIDSTNITYYVNGKNIFGSYNGILKAGEALTIRLELPEGYFVGTKSTRDSILYVMFILPALFCLIGFILWNKYGKDKKIIETVEFYPPNNLNSLEIGYFYKGTAKEKDVISLLIYLANKGFIKIREVEDTFFINSTNFKIIKLKEYDGTDENEKIFLEELFLKGNKEEAINESETTKEATVEETSNEEEVNEVTSSDLYNRFYLTIRKILSNINKKGNGQKALEKGSLSKRILLILMLIITYGLITLVPVYKFGDNIENTIFLNVFFIIIPSIFILVAIYSKSIKIIKVIAVCWGSIFILVRFIKILLPILLVDSIYLLAYIFGIVCITVLIILIKIMNKRSEYGNEMLGKIEGFKKFLETAEKPKLEELVTQDPTYFYNILSYTYVLGISSKWIEKFENIALKAPNWYEGSESFSISSFESFMDSTMDTISSTMSSSDSGDFDGSSGGGSSGSGSGGGGGGSW